MPPYGIPSKNPISEETLQKPISPYGKSKLMVEEIIKDLAKPSKSSKCNLKIFQCNRSIQKILIGEKHIPETHLIPLVLDTALGVNKEITILAMISILQMELAFKLYSCCRSS